MVKELRLTVCSIHFYGAGDAAHVAGRLRERVARLFHVIDDRFVDDASNHGRENVIHDLLIRTVDECDSVGIHWVGPPSRKNGNTRLSGVSMSIVISEALMSIRVRSDLFWVTRTERTSLTRGSAAIASSTKSLARLRVVSLFNSPIRSPSRDP